MVKIITMYLIRDDKGLQSQIREQMSVPDLNSPVSNIESDNSQNIGLEDYNNISVGIFPYFPTPSIKITLG